MNKKKKSGNKIVTMLLIILMVLISILCAAVSYLAFERTLAVETANAELSAQIRGLETELAELEQRVEALTAEPEPVPEENPVSEEIPEENSEESQEPVPEEPQAPSAEEVYQIPSGEALDRDSVLTMTDAYFQSYEITEGDPVFNRINGKSYQPNDNIGLGSLRYLKMPYYDFAGQVRMGEMIVNVNINDRVLHIFRELFQREYGIFQMRLIDDFWQGDGNSSDTKSCDEDNTSCFCYRLSTGGGSLSRHALGYAIDLNPRENPYTTFEDGGGFHCSHANANAFMSPTDRENSGNPAVILKGDFCYELFQEAGFNWGGFWRPIADYQHFEIPR